MKLVVITGEKYINIPAESISTDGTMVYAYKGETLVGAFLIGTFDSLYLSNTRKE